MHSVCIPLIVTIQNNLWLQKVMISSTDLIIPQEMENAARRPRVEGTQALQDNLRPLVHDGTVSATDIEVWQAIVLQGQALLQTSGIHAEQFPQ